MAKKQKPIREKRRPQRKITTEELRQIWDQQSEHQEWKEWRVDQELDRKTMRHLKAMEPKLQNLANCRICPDRDDCAGTCPAVEMYLAASGKTSESLMRDKIILESEWRPQKNPRCDYREHDSTEDKLSQSEFYENYISNRPTLAAVQVNRDNTIGEIIEALFSGKLSFEQIASENFVSLDYVRDIRDEIADILGLVSEVPTEDQKILRAIIDERLTGANAAEVFGKAKSDISRRIRRAKEKVLKELQ